MKGSQSMKFRWTVLALEGEWEKVAASVKR